MFDDTSIKEWCNSLKGRDKEFVRLVIKKYMREHNYNASITEALVHARKAMILRVAIVLTAYIECKTPKEVLNEWRISKG